MTSTRVPSSVAVLPAPFTSRAKPPMECSRVSLAPSCRVWPLMTFSGPVRSAAWTGSAAHRAVASRLGRRGAGARRARPGARRYRVGEAYILLDFLWQGAARLRELARQGRVAAEATRDGSCRRHRTSVPQGGAATAGRRTKAGCVQPRNRRCPMESGVS
ncbi:exported hypothetical protein [Stenotrophomonas maltophilia]|nr:exported hypothetical protein [Stenotrophomonas maltophilia]